MQNKSIRLIHVKLNTLPVSFSRVKIDTSMLYHPKLSIQRTPAINYTFMFATCMRNIKHSPSQCNSFLYVQNICSEV